MKTKRKGLLIFSAAIVLLALISVIFFPKIKLYMGNTRVYSYTGKDLQNVDNITLLAHSMTVEGSRNSVAGVKEAVRLGANGVSVDLCFRPDGTPVMTDSYENAASAPLIEDLFAAMTDEKYIDVRIYLNIIQLSDLSELNRLTVEYNMISRLFLTGIDESHYGLITSDDTIIPFYLDYDVTAQDVSAMKDGTFTVPEVLGTYGAIGFVIDRTDCSDKVISAFDDYGIPLIVKNINSGNQLCDALISNARTVYVSSIENSANILNGWIANMQERYESSVKSSLKELSTLNK